MAFVAQDKLHCWYRLQWNAQEYQLHLHYSVVNDTSALTTIAGLDALNTYLADTTTALRPGKVLKDTLSPAVTILDVSSQRIYSARTLFRRQNITAGGTWAGGDPVTGNTAANISFHSSGGTRRDISNRHIGPLPPDAAINGLLDTPYKVQVTALADALDDPIALSLGTINLVPIVNGPGAEQRVVVGFNVSDRVGTMRRRTVRVGI